MTNVPTKYQLPTPYGFRDTARTNFFPPPAHTPAHLDTIGENNTPTALKGCGVKSYKLNTFQVPSELLIDKMSNSNSNSTFIALNLCQKTDSKAHHTKTLFNIQKPEYSSDGYNSKSSI